MGRKGKIIACAFLFVAWRAAALPRIDLQLVTANVTNAVYITHAGDGSGRLFIVEQPGRIKIFDGTNLLSSPFLDISSDFTFQCGMGMLHGYVRVVDDIRRVDLGAVRRIVAAHRPATSGSASCCGR